MKTSKLILDIINTNEDMQLRVGEVIRLRRHQLRMERRELGELSGLSINTIRSIEDDPDYSPRWLTVIPILNHLGIQVRFELDDDLLQELKKSNGINSN